MYNPDPFVAKKEVEDRQTAAAKKKEEVSTGQGNARSGAPGGEFTGAIEVKMSSSLRELVEDAIRKVLDGLINISVLDNRTLTLLYFKTHETQRSEGTNIQQTLSEDLYPELTKALSLLNFTPTQISRTLKSLSTSSTLTGSLLASSPTPLDATISHLLLCVPECDLPPRFLAKHAGESFIQSAHKGTQQYFEYFFHLVRSIFTSILCCFRVR